MKTIHVTRVPGSDDLPKLERLRRDLAANGFVVTPDPLWCDVGELGFEGAIRASDIVVAVLTENHADPYIEIGFALGIGKPVILICPPELSVPSALANVPMIRWSTPELEITPEILRFLHLTTISQNTWKSHIDLSLYDLVASNPFFDAKYLENNLILWFQSQGCVVGDQSRDRDIGVDFVIEGYRGYPRTLVQLKHWGPNKRISIGVVRELLGAVHLTGADHAVLVTTSRFTRSALDFASHYREKLGLLQCRDTPSGEPRLAIIDDVEEFEASDPNGEAHHHFDLDIVFPGFRSDSSLRSRQPFGRANMDRLNEIRYRLDHLWSLATAPNQVSVSALKAKYAELGALLRALETEILRPSDEK